MPGERRPAARGRRLSACLRDHDRDRPSDDQQWLALERRSAYVRGLDGREARKRLASDRFELPPEALRGAAAQVLEEELGMEVDKQAQQAQDAVLEADLCAS